MQMSCALCRSEEKICNSHIIPKFFYKSLYDEKRRFHVLSISPEKGNSVKQEGVHEKLLCYACEQKLSVWEGYAHKVLKGEASLSFSNENNRLCVSGLDYEKFRLFQLSILWRAGVSKHSFFEDVKLGPHEKILRKLLLDSDPGPPKKYCSIVAAFGSEGELFEDFIWQPEKLRFDGQVAYRFVFGGFWWVWLVSKQDLPSPWAKVTLQPPGAMIILRKDARELLSSFAAKISKKIPRDTHVIESASASAVVRRQPER